MNEEDTMTPDQQIAFTTPRPAGGVGNPHEVWPIRQGTGTGLFPRVVGFQCSCGVTFDLTRLKDGFGVMKCVAEERRDPGQ